MSLDALRAASADLHARRNWLKAWSTTDARNPTLREMARAAGMSPMALKRQLGLMAASEERLAKDVEGRTAEFEKQEAALRDERRRLDSQKAAITKADTPERRAAEALDDELRDVQEELQGVQERLGRLWDAICSTIEGDGYVVLGRSLRATPDAQRPEALRRASDVMSLMP